MATYNFTKNFKVNSDYTRVVSSGDNITYVWTNEGTASSLLSANSNENIYAFGLRFPLDTDFPSLGLNSKIKTIKIKFKATETRSGYGSIRFSVGVYNSGIVSAEDVFLPSPSSNNFLWFSSTTLGEEASLFETYIATKKLSDTTDGDGYYNVTLLDATNSYLTPQILNNQPLYISVNFKNNAAILTNTIQIISPEIIITYEGEGHTLTIGSPWIYHIKNNNSYKIDLSSYWYSNLSPSIGEHIIEENSDVDLSIVLKPGIFLKTNFSDWKEAIGWGVGIKENTSTTYFILSNECSTSITMQSVNLEVGTFAATYAHTLEINPKGGQYIDENGNTSTAIYTKDFNSSQQYIAISSTVTSNGLTSAATDTGLESGYYISKPEREGYQFAGWKSSNDDTIVAYSFSAGAMYGFINPYYNSESYQDKKITIEAQWIQDEYVITYNANGGDSTPSSQSIAVGSTAFLASAINRNSSPVDGYTVSFNNSQTGITSKTQQNTISYTFKEWNTNSWGTGTSYAAGASLTPSTSGSITLYAIWNETTTLGSITAPTINSYTATSVKEVEVYRNDGSGNSSILESKATSSYSPSGWYTASSGGTIEVSSGGTFTPKSSTTLYAQWRETTGTYPNVSLPSNWTRSGWTLLGFSTHSTDTSATYVPGASVSPNNTYYAIWKKTITLSYDSGDISPQSITIYNATNSATFTISSTVPTRTGYTFDYWTDGSNSYDPEGSITLTKNTTLGAVWRTNSHTLTTKVNPDNSGYIKINVNGVQSNSNTFDYNTIITLTACGELGYSFVYWEDNNSTANPRSLTMPDKDVTVEAVFKKDTYKLNINSNTDIKVWMRSEKENGTWSDWLQLSAVNNLSGAQTCQFVFEDGEEYEFTSCSNGSTFIEEYTNYLISESMTLTVLGTKIPTINKIYVGNELKTSGYINDPEVSFNENIKSIWIGDKQIMGKAPTRKYHYKKDTILGNTLYIGYEESEINKFEAFYKYTNLETVIFPPYEIAQKYFDIGTRAFFDNKNLSKVNLNNSVQTISWTAFYGCSNLKKIFIPASVSDMSKNPFRYGAGIEKFRVDKNNLYYSTDFQGILYNKNMTKIESYTTGKKKPYYIFPKSVTIIGDYAFSNTGTLKEIYYEGTEEEWNSIEILSGNNSLSSGIIEIIFNYKEEK